MNHFILSHVLTMSHLEGCSDAIVTFFLAGTSDQA
jgi:hypothetical protein